MKLVFVTTIIFNTFIFCQTTLKSKDSVKLNSSGPVNLKNKKMVVSYLWRESMVQK